MAKKVYRKFRGLITNPNQLEVTDGALARAENVSMVRPGVIQPRKGFTSFFTLGGGSTRTATQMFEFQSTLFAHANDAGSDFRLYRNDGVSTWTQLSGSIEDPDPQGSGFRLHTAIANDVCYFPESQGLRKFESPSGTYAFAGVPRCPDIDRSQSATENDASGILAPEMQRAYRATVFYQRTSDLAQLEGSPSGRTTMRNVSTVNTQRVTVRVRLPKLANTDTDELTTDYWVRLYASPISSLDTEPFEDMALVHEVQLTSGNISAGYIDILDITPDELRGAHLYTDPSQQGVAQMNEAPPFAKCIAQYKGAILLGNIENRKQMEIQIVSAGGSVGIQDGDTLTIEDGDGGSFTVTAKATPGLSTDYELHTADTPSQNVTFTTQNLVSAINRHTSNTFVYAYYMGSPSDPRSLGRFLLVKRSFSSGSIFPYVGGSDNNECFEPVLPKGGRSSSVAPVFEDFRNGWALSKVSQGDAYPPAQNGRLGPGNITRIVATNEAAYFFHDLGEVWVMTGEPPVDGLGGTLHLERWRSELTLLAPQSVQVMDGTLFALTDRGVVAIRPEGYTIASDPIAPTLTEAVNNADDIFRDCWAFVHPVDRRYGLGIKNGEGIWTFYIYQAEADAWVTMPRDFACGVWSHSDRNLWVAEGRLINQEAIATSPFPFSDNGSPFTSTVALPTFTAGDQSVPCQMREVQVLVEEDTPAQVVVNVGTEYSSVTTLVPSLGSMVFRSIVPMTGQRGMRHDISLSIDTDSLWNIGGIALLFNPYAERGTK